MTTSFAPSPYFNIEAHADISNILVPTDFSAASVRALKIAIGLATLHQARIHLVHAITMGEYPLVMPEGIAPNLDSVYARAEREIEKIAHHLVTQKIDFTRTLEF